ncbi:glycosyl hydrolase-related protein [Photobacterium rosenbergii]|uniref:glycoside hydrolase family 38 N-terminal domain-containing protein n=1 Tax=Photobacterium rosenbergii TaxID=294936 RepID=UPI001C99E1AF|nr:glycosyl hydrolase-related protein [Photobacterium rosenbergii]MBY5946698.1 hypothetical protein [Photobacterium rosenbergii]
MSDKKIANVVMQTHWDNEWYFTDREAQVQLTYNVREILSMLERGEMKYFLFDGQTAAIQDYLDVCPEDRSRIVKLVEEGKLFIGPWHTQAETFAVSGESMINNLIYGIEYADQLGGSSYVSYLPDSFGHPTDFPKIFNGLNIENLSIRRGMGDKHNVPTEFWWESNDGSKIMTNVLIDGYHWAVDPYFEGDLLTRNIRPECTTNDMTSLELAAHKAPTKNFLLPLGEDQTPAFANFYELLDKYNKESDLYEFVETTYDEFFAKVREEAGDSLPTYKGELLCPQYSRIHKSINSVRYDVKQIHDKVERLMTYTVQPLMAMADKVGLPYERGLLKEVWNLLSRAQTHSVCTNTDETNERIYVRLKEAYDLALTAQAFIARKLAVSSKYGDNSTPMVVANTLPTKRTLTDRFKIYTKNEHFALLNDGQELPYSIVGKTRPYGGVIRGDENLHDEEKYYFVTEVEMTLEMNGFSYKTIEVDDSKAGSDVTVAINETANVIENDDYEITLKGGELTIANRKTGVTYTDAIRFSNDSDAGDNYDHSPMENDWELDLDLNNSLVTIEKTPATQTLTAKGKWLVPANMEERAARITSSELAYELSLSLCNTSDVIGVHIEVDNKALNHRLRMVVDSQVASEFSYAGTQFSEIAREVNPPELKTWKQDGWLEEPTTTEPLLNTVALKEDGKYTAIFTQGCKEYQIVGEKFDKIAITLFRACGHFGLPDLSRRPGRASGTPNKITATPDSQLQKRLTFDLGIVTGSDYKSNLVRQQYVEFATDTVFYHEQNLCRAGEYNISFFATNPLREQVPANFSLLEVEATDAVFSTLTKAKDNNGYLLRMYNCEEQAIEAGQINTVHGYQPRELTNLLEQSQGEVTPTLRQGELRTVRIA